jgi:hypothetical protein
MDAVSKVGRQAALSAGQATAAMAGGGAWRGAALIAGNALGGAIGGAFGSTLDQLESFDPNTFDWNKALQNIGLAAAMGAAQGAAGGANMWAKRVCFVAGTPLLTPDGAKAIEQFQVGDLVLSRDEHNVEGAVEAKAVEEVFVNHGLVLYLHVGGRRIGTTGEHPFFVRGKGWLPANEIIAGDHLVGHDNQWVVVEAVERTEEFQTVYNLRVADSHTYFVGAPEWGFSLWAHNTYVAKQVKGKWVIYDDVGHKYVNKAQMGMSTNTRGAKGYTAASAQSRAAELNKTYNALAGPLQKQGLTPSQIKQLFNKHGGLKGKLDFKQFFTDIVTAPANGTTREGRLRVDWADAVKATKAARQQFGWTLPNKAKALQWQVHQKAVSKKLGDAAKLAGDKHGDQIELKVGPASGGKKTRMIADDIVRPGKGSATTETILGDAKFKQGVDLSKKTGPQLRGTLTAKQAKAWEMIDNHASKPVVVTVHKGAEKLGLTPGAKLEPATISLMFYVSDKKGGVHPVSYQ